LSSPRERHCAAVLSSSELIFAGGAKETVEFLDVVEIYDIETGGLVALPPLRMPNAAQGCTVHE